MKAIVLLNIPLQAWKSTLANLLVTVEGESFCSVPSTWVDCNIIGIRVLKST